MNKLSLALLAGAMTVGTCAIAADEVKPNPQAKPQDCSKLSGKQKDECTQATPAGPVDMKSGKQEKKKSEKAKDRDPNKAGNQATSPPSERPPTSDTQTNPPAGKPTQ